MIDYTLPLDQLPDPLPIEPLRKPFDVTITPPGSKSITCRAYVLAALAQGESKIIRPLRADDTDHLLNALCTLGAEARWVKSDEHDGEDVYIKGVAGRFPRGGNLYMGEGGTPTRFMIACACLAKEPVTIDASPRMRERPIAEGVDMLRQLGAKIEYVEEEGRLPVRVVPSETFKGKDLTIAKTASSQFVSAVMLIGAARPWFNLCIKFVERPTSAAYLDVTSHVLMHWGLYDLTQSERGGMPLHRQRNTWSYGGRPLLGRQFAIETDASSCVYWAAASICTNSTANLPIRLDSVQPDVDFLVQLKRAGLSIVPIDNSTQIVGSDRRIELPTVNCPDWPDGSMALGIVAASLGIVKMITGLHTLRVKETDRIAALANELRKVGCTVNTGEDWIEITPPAKSSHIKDAASDDQREEDGGQHDAQSQPPSSSPNAPTSQSKTTGGSSDAASTKNHIIIETYNDHRMAMAFAVLGLNPPNGVPLAIRNPKCVAKSYPGFWKDFAKLYAGSRQ